MAGLRVVVGRARALNPGFSPMAKAASLAHLLDRSHEREMREREREREEIVRTDLQKAELITPRERGIFRLMFS